MAMSESTVELVEPVTEEIRPTASSRSTTHSTGSVPSSSGRGLKVLHVYKTFLPDSIGGLEQSISHLVQATQALGVSNRILSLSRDPNPRFRIWHGAEHYRFRRTIDLASNAMSIELMMNFGPHVTWADIVHFHFPWPFGDMLHYAWRVKKPTVVTYHSDIVRQRNWMRLYQPLMRSFLGSVTRIVATSPNYLKTSDVLQQFAEKTEVIPLGLDEKFYPSPRVSVRTRWKAALGEGFFLFIGVIRYYKGLHILLDAVAGTNLPVVIVGAGPIEQELRIKASRMKLNNVRFLGPVPEEDKVALLELSGAVVFPSHLRSEAFGLTLLEGAMHSRPLISSEIGTGTSFINLHEKTGIVVRPGNPAELRSAMLRLAASEELRNQLGANARARFLELFTSDRMGHRYFNLYQSIDAVERNALRVPFYN